ncbi:endonuclease/exonuclease/phosphatase family protein [Streptomyces sp. NPDC048419]|uniref:endonuclease/exonuclease/phosphatase family protein n=1 Tax=Streptomyces sp. NPDC048419 TaxID=3365547 RepID=UPI00371E1FF1
MRVATFNVLHGRTLQDGRPASATSGGAGLPLAEAVASLDADVLALQEVDRLQERSGHVDQARLAAEAAQAREWRYASAVHGRAMPGYGWTLDPAEAGLRVYGPQDAATQGDVPSYGIALLSRLPVREWRARRFAPAPFGLPLRVAGRPGLTLVRDQPRAALAAVMAGEQGVLTVVAVHLSFVPGWNIRQLLAVRDWISDLPRPHVLLGDFNLIGLIPRVVLSAAEFVAPVTGRTRRGRPSRRGSALCAGLCSCLHGGVVEQSARPSRLDGWRDLARVATYPSHRPVVQFDHVLATGTCRCTPVSSGAPRMPVSDHRPVVVDLPW